MIVYEWDAESIQTVEGEEEVTDHNQFEGNAKGLQHVLDAAPHAGCTKAIVLVRDEWSVNGDLESRAWAYVTSDMLPEQFNDANGNPVASVPQRFPRMLKKALGA